MSTIPTISTHIAPPAAAAVIAPRPRPRRSRGGNTLPELLVAAGVFALIGLGTLSILSATVTASAGGGAQVDADQSAGLALQAVVGDLREASRVAVYNGATRVASGVAGDRLVVTRPRTTAAGYYNRYDPDLTNPVRFYLSDETGAPAAPGTVLWRREEGTGRQRRLRRNVRALRFVERGAGRVEVSLTAEVSAARAGTKRAELSRRVVFMRNKQ